MSVALEILAVPGLMALLTALAVLVRAWYDGYQAQYLRKGDTWIHTPTGEEFIVFTVLKGEGNFIGYMCSRRGNRRLLTRKRYERGDWVRCQKK